MVETLMLETEPLIGVERPPTEDELPYDDGEPMETQRHILQMYLLLEPLSLHWADRDDFFVGGNMFVYFSPEQVKTYDFKGPDVFVVQGVSRRERKSWVVWQEGKAPDVVIELLSDSTAHKDKTDKKLVYQNRLRAPEYFWFDPFSGELAGFALRQGKYTPLKGDAQGSLLSQQLQLKLTHWSGAFQGIEADWLRWATVDGHLLPTQQEAADEERQRANQAHQRADEERQRADEERQRADEERQRADEERQRAEELKALLTRYQTQFGDLPE